MIVKPVLLAAALIATAASARDDMPAATPIGAPLSCVPINQIRETQVRDDRTIDFIMNGRDKVYRNTLPNSCPELGSERAFAYETSLSQLCNVDIITVFRQGGGIRRGASCGLGQFQPVALAKPAKKAKRR